MEAVLKDERFARIAKEKKFRSVGRKQRKVQIDQRFQSMFSEPKFVSKCSVDKRGRPTTSFSSKENFKKYYALKDSDESDSEEEEQETTTSQKEGEEEPELLKQGEEEEEESSSNESIEAGVRVSWVKLILSQSSYWYYRYGTGS